MPDITMCTGKDCPIAETCYRFIAKPGYWQSWFLEVPYDHEKEECDELYERYEKE